MLRAQFFVIIDALQYPVVILDRRDIRKMSKIYLAGKHSRDVIIGGSVREILQKSRSLPAWNMSVDRTVITAARFHESDLWKMCTMS